ncbi:MAG: beta-propeller domain-containing protein [Clostridiales bacterium]|nr:beta-propeller domain-containing protein [Clostridiales bacterium]
MRRVLAALSALFVLLTAVPALALTSVPSEPPATASPTGTPDATQSAPEPTPGPTEPDEPGPAEEEPAGDDDADDPGDLPDEPSGGEEQGEEQGGEQDEEDPGFSDTNEQVAGVREADVLKTDGRYIYAINSKSLVIVKADNGKMELVSKIPQPSMDEGQVYFEMYTAGDRLIAIRHGYNEAALLNELGRTGEYDPAETSACIAYPIGGYITDTSVDIFDISDRKAPVRLHTLTQSGDYNSSRMVGGYLYLITSYYGGDMSQLDASDPRTFVPLFARDDEQFTPGEGDIYLPPGTSWPCFTVISGIDAAGGGNFISNKSVYGEAGAVYVSQGAVYLTRTSSEETEQEMQLPGQGQDDAGPVYIAYSSMTETIITKLTLDSGRIEPGAQTRAPGFVLNQFSLDEYGGVLRLVTTCDKSNWYWFKDTEKVYSEADMARLPAGETKTTNALYTLGAALEPVGSITDLAPGERVYSCRFMGDTAYFVTFRQVDPLFSVDVSNPAAPKVIGELKIPGFSEYLHPYEKGRLFGLGRNADPETGMQQGLKLTMFDNSDPGDVKELHSELLDDEYSAAEQNHKAILVSADKALIAFPTFEKYLVYGYDDAGGFKKIAEVAFDGGGNVWAEIRGLFIGGTFYVVSPNRINAYTIGEAFAAAGNLRVDEGASSVNRWTYWMPGRIVSVADPVTVTGSEPGSSGEEPADTGEESDLGPPPDTSGESDLGPPPDISEDSDLGPPPDL